MRGESGARLLTLLLLSIMGQPTMAQQQLDDELDLPVETIMANRHLMVRDMGKAAKCKQASPILAQIKTLMFQTEAKQLARHGFPIANYRQEWDSSFKEGQQSPVPNSACEGETQSWNRMLENIRKKQSSK